MPVFHSFFTDLGKMPSGTALEEVIKLVKEAAWHEQEESRVAAQVKKVGTASNPISTDVSEVVQVVAPVGDEGDDAPDEVVEGEGLEVAGDGASLMARKGPPRLPSTIRPMPDDWFGNAYFHIWMHYGPIAPHDDISHSLTGPGETIGRESAQSSRSKQRAAQRKRSAELRQSESSSKSLDVDADDPQVGEKVLTLHQVGEMWQTVTEMRKELKVQHDELKNERKINFLLKMYELQQPGEQKDKIKAQLDALLAEQIGM